MMAINQEEIRLLVEILSGSFEDSRKNYWLSCQQVYGSLLRFVLLQNNLVTSRKDVQVSCHVIMGQAAYRTEARRLLAPGWKLLDGR